MKFLRKLKKTYIYIQTLEKNLGACLIIDYGKNNNIGNTLQSVKNHKYSDPLKYQGESDLSSLVNFGSYKKLFKRI